nr:sigma 54-interacting transcriptional regulator [Saprospiraceae bacterium]
MSKKLARTLGDLKKSGYKPKTIKEEVKDNLISFIQQKNKVFDGIFGYDETVLPDIEKALLAKHNILLLGLRGQAKTRIARGIQHLLDDKLPVIRGSEINDDPLNPISYYGKKVIEEMGDETPIDWIDRADRYVEKLATPDVSVSDLIGDLDPIKAVNQKLSYSDERSIHFGLIPRSHRGIFVINELPDLQARIQVALLNILEEGDIQVRGFKLRLPLDILFVFTANPEDYTNRGNIITPLKDRIESQITTHYPTDPDISRAITKAEAKVDQSVLDDVDMAEAAEDLLEFIAFQARESEMVDHSSGVSARMSISARELLYSAAERRMLINGEYKTSIRFSDFWSIIPAITGKVELLYEGELKGPHELALEIMGEALKELFLEYFPNPTKKTKTNDQDIYNTVRAWFEGKNTVELHNDETDELRLQKLEQIPGLTKVLQSQSIDPKDVPFFKEMVLHALAEFEIINKEIIAGSHLFKDPLAGMLDDWENEDDI